jgi:hypothetical protein
MLDGKRRDLVPLTGMVRRWAWRLNHRMAHWPLSPPSWWCRRPVWVASGRAVWAGEVLTPAALHLMPLGLVPVLLAAWCGDFIWSLGLALGLPWGACLSWWCQDAPWALWVEAAGFGCACPEPGRVSAGGRRHDTRLHGPPRRIGKILYAIAICT